mmetsp:Transcript_13544/g.28969  ORF Transcript_13544/g.28969 Transcript_13544/m.28969 type:complete len:565 (-) Transcript_13544:713-2407(-)
MSIHAQLTGLCTQFTGRHCALPYAEDNAYILSAVCIVLAIVVLWNYSSSIPGPVFHLPLIGDAPFVFKNPVRFLFSRYLRYGPVFRLKLLNVPVVVVADMATLRPLLQRLEGSVFRVPFSAFDALMEDMDNVVDHDVHSAYRKLLLQELGPGGLSAKFDGALQRAEAFISRWCSAGRIAAWHEAQDLSMEWGMELMGLRRALPNTDMKWLKQRMLAFCDGLYAVPINVPGTGLHAAMKAKREVQQALKAEARAVVEHIQTLASSCGPVQPGSGKAVRTPRDVQEAMQAQYAAARGTDAEGNKAVQVQRTADDDGKSCDVPTMLHVELVTTAMRKDLDTYDAVLGVLHTAVAAGDTTRFSIIGALTLLGLQPQLQERLWQEQQQVIANHGPEVTYNVVHNHMPFLEVTLKEMLRILPAAGGGFRQLTADMQCGQLTLRAGTYVWYNGHIMHATDPAMWDGSPTLTKNGFPPHMDVFDLENSCKPERWLSEETKPKQYLTFGHGVHNCLGQPLVYLELKILICMLVRRARWSMEAGYDILRRAPTLLPFIPAPGTDGMKITLRDKA